MSRTTRSLSTVVLMAALSCSSRQDEMNNGVSADAGSSDVNVPFCELGAVEAATAPAGDAEVPLNHRPTHA